MARSTGRLSGRVEIRDVGTRGQARHGAARTTPAGRAGVAPCARQAVSDFQRIHCDRQFAVGARSRADHPAHQLVASLRSEEHTSELQSLLRIPYADYCLKKKKIQI